MIVGHHHVCLQRVEAEFKAQGIVKKMGDIGDIMIQQLHLGHLWDIETLHKMLCGM